MPLIEKIVWQKISAKSTKKLLKVGFSQITYADCRDLYSPENEWVCWRGWGVQVIEQTVRSGPLSWMTLNNLFFWTSRSERATLHHWKVPTYLCSECSYCSVIRPGADQSSKDALAESILLVARAKTCSKVLLLFARFVCASHIFNKRKHVRACFSKSAFAKSSFARLVCARPKENLERQETNKNGRGIEWHLPKTDESVVWPAGEHR